MDILWWLVHILGMDNATSPFYLAWSGWIGNLSIFGIFFVMYRKLICHVEGCHKLAFHHVDGTPYVVCKNHHPTGGITASDVHEAHRLHLRKKKLQ